MGSLYAFGQQCFVWRGIANLGKLGRGCLIVCCLLSKWLGVININYQKIHFHVFFDFRITNYKFWDLRDFNPKTQVLFFLRYYRSTFWILSAMLIYQPKLIIQNYRDEIHWMCAPVWGHVGLNASHISISRGFVNFSLTIKFPTLFLLRSISIIIPKILDSGSTNLKKNVKFPLFYPIKIITFLKPQNKFSINWIENHETFIMRIMHIPKEIKVIIVILM